MRLLLFALILGLSTFSFNSYSQTFQSECSCDITIENATQEIPSRGRSGQETRNKTVCFIGNFEYQLDSNKRFGENVTLCVSEKVTLKFNNIDFKGGKTINNFGTIDIKDNSLSGANVFSKNGTFIFSGNDTQTIDFNSKTEINSLIIDNPSNVELSNTSIDIFTNIELINGNLITNYSLNSPENNLITFKSDSTKSAMLSEIKGNSKIDGAVRIERFFQNNNRAFRYVSSSVNSLGSINDDWQEGVNNTENNYSSNKNPNPGYGTHITGSKIGENGLDATLTGNPSLYTWNTNSGSWNAITNTIDNQLEAGNSYSILIRGDRKTNIYSNNSTYTGSTTLRSTGEIVSGDVDVSSELNSTPNGFTLIGNPYQAQVNLKKALNESSSQLKQNFYYVWSPELQKSGGYITVDLDSEPVDYVPSVKVLDTSSQVNFKYIQPNQSVFIETASTASEENKPTLVFKESYKTDEFFSNEAFSNPEQIGKIDLTLIRKNDNQVVDGVRFKFNNSFSNEIDSFDATKVWNSEESFSIYSNQSNYLAIEKRKYPVVDERLKFWIGNYTDQNYSMLVQLEEIEGFSVYLIDNYTQDIIKLESGENEIDFDVDSSISESTASDRFELSFEPITLSTEHNEISEEFQMYPNPASSEYVYIQYADSLNEEHVLEVFSMIGQKMKIGSERISNSEIKLNTSSLSAGIYLVKLSNGSHSTTQKLIIN